PPRRRARSPGRARQRSPASHLRHRHDDRARPRGAAVVLSLDGGGRSLLAGPGPAGRVPGAAGCSVNQTTQPGQRQRWKLFLDGSLVMAISSPRATRSSRREKWVFASKEPAVSMRPRGLAGGLSRYADECWVVAAAVTGRAGTSGQRMPLKGGGGAGGQRGGPAGRVGGARGGAGRGGGPWGARGAFGGGRGGRFPRVIPCTRPASTQTTPARYLDAEALVGQRRREPPLLNDRKPAARTWSDRPRA